SLVRRTRRLSRSEPYPEEVVIADAAACAGGVERHAENVLTGRVRDVPRVEVRPVLISASVRYSNRSGPIDAVYLDVEYGTGAEVGDANPKRIRPGRRDVDCVLQPFAGLCLHHIESATCVGCRLEIDVRCAIDVSRIAGGRVEVGDRLAAFIEVLSLQRTRQWRRRAAERCISSRRRWRRRWRRAPRGETEPVV